MSGWEEAIDYQAYGSHGNPDSELMNPNPEVTSVPSVGAAEEWTVTKEGDVVRLNLSRNHWVTQNGIKGKDFFQTIADAHNASLARTTEKLEAENKRLKQMISDYQESVKEVLRDEKRS